MELLFRDWVFCSTKYRHVAISTVSVYQHQKHMALPLPLPTSALSLYGVAISANFSPVHILCMRPVYRTQCGCMQRAHQRAANNHKEQTKPDTFMPGYTTNTLCSQLIWTGFSAVIFHQKTLTALTSSPELPNCSCYVVSLIDTNCWAASIKSSHCYIHCSGPQSLHPFTMY